MTTNLLPLIKKIWGVQVECNVSFEYVLTAHRIGSCLADLQKQSLLITDAKELNCQSTNKTVMVPRHIRIARTEIQRRHNASI